MKMIGGTDRTADTIEQEGVRVIGTVGLLRSFPTSPEDHARLIGLRDF